VATDDLVPDRLGVPVLVLFAAFTIASFLPFAASYLRGGYNAIDFEAFYCGGRVLASGANPYLQEPLHACESRVHWAPLQSDLVVPLPQPPVVIAAFVPFGVLPYAAARLAWTTLACALLAASVYLLRKLYGVPAAAGGLAVLLSGILSLTLGQVVPGALFGVMLAAYGLRKRNVVALAAGLALLTSQPAVLLSVVLACVVFGTGGVRITALLVCAAAAGLSLAVAGVQTNWAYVDQILPLHAYAELTNDTQLSLAGMLAQWGVGARTALLAGTISFVAALALGVIVARALAKRFDDDSMLALVPPAFSIFLGTFVHLQLYLLAVPLAAVLAYRLQSRAVAAALFGVALPWEWAAMTYVLIPSLGIVSILFARMWMTRSLYAAAAWGLGSAAAMFALAVSYVHTAPSALSRPSIPIDPRALAEYAWIRFEHIYGPVGNGLALDIARLLSIAALGCVLYAAARRAPVTERYA
jgi:hypothetical protein